MKSFVITLLGFLFTLISGNIIVQTCPNDSNFSLRSRENCMLQFSNKKVSLIFESRVQVSVYDCENFNKCITYQAIS